MGGLREGRRLASPLFMSRVTRLRKRHASKENVHSIRAYLLRGPVGYALLTWSWEDNQYGRKPRLRPRV